MPHILATSLALDNDGSDGSDASDASEETTLAISEGTHCATQQRGGAFQWPLSIALHVMRLKIILQSPSV